MKHRDLPWNKIFKATIISGVIGFVISFILMILFTMLFPGLEAEYVSSLFRPWSDPLMYYVYLNPFVFSFFMSIIYYVMKDSLNMGKKKLCKKGVHFGVLIWLLGIPGMLMTYSSFSISAEMVASWTLQMLILYAVYGVIIVKVFDEK